MADSTSVELNAEHSPKPNAVRAFGVVNQQIKHEWIKLRHHWDKHEPRMFASAKDLSDQQLAEWDLEKDLVAIRAGSTAYGTIIFGKIRIPALEDGYVHVRIHDGTEKGQDDVVFHSIFTDEIRNEEGKIIDYRAVQSGEKALEWFSE
ncbi:hypothetical protein BCR35DRAFT_308038 [Leucosporidium creatinivorum]|uniref:Uncharacterized protein n=1 Tax=Leucosporidium creatinivorum TaxID=106004 RepID=A0A1Y2ED01_9BASI|nr:hypothetical protein BCR35DRAFT_308038 [Leucosporidium creatinivorum]